MSVIRKYEFGLLDLTAPQAETFDAMSMVLDQPPAPPAPAFTQEDIDAAQERGFAAGHAQGEAAALSRIEMRLADTMEQISYALRDAKDAQREAILQIEHEAARLTLACFKKLFPVFLAECGTTESEALIAQTLAQAMSEPRLIVRTPAEDEAALTRHLNDAARNAGFEGKLSVIVDEKLMTGDCRIEWSNGGMNRESGTVIGAIEKAIRQSIPGFAEGPAFDIASTDNKESAI